MTTYNTETDDAAPNIKHSKYSLFGRVGELVFSPAVVALLDAGVGPKSFDRLHVRAFEGRHALVVD